MALFSNFVDIACYNAYVVFLSTHSSYHVGKSHRRRLFLEELSHMMILDAITDRESRAISNASFDRILIKRKRCSLCPREDDRKSSECCKCGATICRSHTKMKKKSFTYVSTHCPTN